MENIFESIYQELQRIHADYDAAKEADNEAGKNAARTDYEKLCERINEKGAAFVRIARAYREARDKGNEHIDFHDVIWDKDVEGLITCMRGNGIEHFTFSSGWSSAVETAWLFQENGCTLEGLIRINGDSKGFGEEGYEQAPAYLFRV